MTDILKLLDDDIPLQKRYDTFLFWDHENTCGVTYLIAEKLGIKVSYVEVFYELGTLDAEEFESIDKLKITIDALFFVVKQNKELRLKIYANYENIIKNATQPIRALKKFIDDDCEPDFKMKLHSISAGAYGSIASYLKSLNIEDGSITRQFRGLLVSISKLINNGDEMSDKQANWVIRAITHDKNMSFNIFTNDILKTDYPNDFIIFQDIISDINILVDKA